MQSLSLADVREVLLEFLRSIGEDGRAADAERERQRIKRMLAALGQEQVDDPRPDASAAEATTQSIGKC